MASQTTVKTPSTAALKEILTKQGYQVFDYVDEVSGDAILMQQ